MEKSISFSALGVRIEIHLVSYICNSSSSSSHAIANIFGISPSTICRKGLFV